MSDTNAGRGRAGGGANVVAGMVLVALGLLFLIAQFLDASLERVLWPFFIIVPGLSLFVAMALGDRSLAVLAIPASIVTTVGLILLFQNTFGYWESWAYAWALIPTAAGIGMMIQGTRSNQQIGREKGMRVTRLGIILFLAFGVFFELVVNISGRWTYNQWLWPLLLVAVGVILLLRRSDR